MKIREKGQLMSAAEIDRTLMRLAHEIVERNSRIDQVALVGIRRRGVPLAERLAARIEQTVKKKVLVATIDVTLYRDDLSTVAPQPVVKTKDLGVAVDGRTLILVDDVLYTGRTIRASMNALFSYGRPARVHLCVLIDRGWRELPIEANYVGRNVQTAANEIIEVRLQEVDSEERVLLVEKVDE
ncbi:MAG: bifunctional pyr operon transcriptional regulator/uracil phosphoribosyltransferase PyrR [Acidobacteria bacterium]|nr:bifunctional pyr operon transcriptional regulator/uracil phosphoribosyltransferase PyrR [Acidobacteriota bacterium]